MPMPIVIASGTITGTAGIAGGAPTRLVTTATLFNASGNNRANEPGLYAIAWVYGIAATGSAAGTNLIPCFTWWDVNAATTVTATGGFIGGLLAAGSATALSGQASGAFSLHTSATGFRVHGFETFIAASGGSGVSAYIQVSSLGTGGATARFDYRVLKLDDWGA